MEKILYNKLIGDNVPANMLKLGKQFQVRTITDDGEYCTELLKKVVEEAEELRTAPTKEATLKEIADVLEVIDALKAFNGFSEGEVRAMKEARLQKRGGFLKRILLLWSEDDGYEARKQTAQS